MAETTALSDQDVSSRLSQLRGWARVGSGGSAAPAITREFKFKDYYETMAFVNAVAWIAHRADHHPDLTVGYNRVTVTYSTHSAGGITAKDFASATKVEQLLAT